tara:strand:+ start:1208 stop:1384 length:177 start_codon:yes stop_codon:yes gene_type:complete
MELKKNNNIEISTSDLDILELTKSEKIDKLKERIFVLQMVLDSEQQELNKLKTLENIK